MPSAYADADWARVREPKVREWALGIDARCRRRTEGQMNWALAGRGALMVGPRGTGKSSAAALCCREAVTAGRSVQWSYVPDLADSLAGRPAERAAVVRHQVHVDLVVWDDFGVRDLADWEIGFFDQIVEGRYRAYRPMIVTSNHTPAMLAADPRIGRLVDRWQERTAAALIVLGGASMRANGKGWA